MKNSFIGSPIERREDLRFLRGRGEYVDDLARRNVLHAAILRSSVAHGRIRSIDTAPARALPGVHSVITAKDIGNRVPRVPMRLQPLPDFEPFGQPVIAETKVRHVGEAIALVLAESPGIAEDAVGLIEVEIEALPAVADRHVSAKNESLLFEETGTNQAIKFHAVRGDAAAAFKTAPYTRRESFRTQRHMALPMEPRGLLAEWDAARGRLTVSGGAKVLFFNRRTLAKQLGLAEDQVEIVENDVGGGFGARGEFYPEDFLIPFAARQTGRPVKWTEDRRENLMCMNHAREAECDCRDRLHARRHHPGAARPRLCGRRRLYANQRRGRRAQRGAVHVRPLPDREYRHRRRAAAHQQDAGRHLSRAGPLRDRFLPRTLVRHRRAGFEHRPGRVPPPQSRPARGHALLDRHHYAVREQGPVRQRRLSRHARALPQGDRLGGKIEARRQADRRALSWAGGRLLHRRGRRRSEGERPHGARAGWRLFGLRRVVGDRPGSRNVIRADRRRRARSPDGPHQRRASRRARPT